MAALGANIILCARNAQSLGEAERLCRVINPSGFYVAHIMDVSEKHSFHEFESLLRGHGQPAHVDILVLNAGVASRGSVLETEVMLAARTPSASLLITPTLYSPRRSRG